MAKSLFYFTVILFYFIFLFGLTTKKEYRKVSHDNIAYHSHVSGYYKVMSHGDVT